MLHAKTITLSPGKYSDDLTCTVTFQVGDKSYNTVAVKLTPEAAREVVDLAIKRATEMLVVASSDIRVEGEPLPLIEQAPIDAPEFAEVDQTPPPAPQWQPPEIPAEQPVSEETL